MFKCNNKFAYEQPLGERYLNTYCIYWFKFHERFLLYTGYDDRSKTKLTTVNQQLCRLHFMS